ncbi:MAG TPA: hypothetical protein VGV07_21865 [Devosia sp.]|jgi:hypothetical protein|uniref:hypothetical protein n=1 Tax=Devosia sp. TaxID=1871048 RepID=UPI002DDCF97B|nr:hypothetical protein [Devosia sp.]HEV2517914.1 hypothetical protein [Devosia sp.]
MSEQRPEIELPRHEYRRAFDRPLASPKHLRIAFAGFLLAAIAGSLFCGLVVPHLWWLQLFVIPIAMYAGATLAGLWPNFFFGNDPSKDDFT